MPLAPSGKEALLLALKLKPSIISLDILLLGAAGWNVLKDLKKDYATADIPILVIFMDEGKNYSIPWGAFDHLIKPVEKECLLSSLQKVKGTRAANSSPRILIVDDEPAIVELLSFIIEKDGYKSICAYGAEKQLMQDKQGNPPERAERS